MDFMTFYETGYEIKHDYAFCCDIFMELMSQLQKVETAYFPKRHGIKKSTINIV